MIWRLILYLEKVRWKRVAIGAVPVAALIAAGVVFAVLRSGGDTKETSTTRAPEPPPSTNLYYLRAVAPKTRVRGCSMHIRFTWKPDYNADQYIGAPALITASGSGIAGSYRSRFTEKGMSVEVDVSLAGGYQVWSARVSSLDGDPPGNDTTIQAAPPRNTKCG